LKVDFRGLRVTSDGGVILVRELDERLSVKKLIEEHLSDSRQGLNKRAVRSTEASVYSRLAGFAWSPERGEHCTPTGLGVRYRPARESKLNRWLSTFGGKMKLLKYLPLALAVVFAALSTSAQSNPGNIVGSEFQTPKNGMTQEYEKGRKLKADWQKQQKDPAALLVFQVLTGRDTGTYIVSRDGLHWSDMDHPAISDAADTEEFDKAVGPYVASVTDSYYEFLPKFSNPDTSPLPAKYSETLILRVKSGKDADFRTAVSKISGAEKKANPDQHTMVYELANGGYSGTYVLIFPHASWAGFEGNPNAKPMEQVVNEAYGPDEASTILADLDNSIESEYTEILEFRQDLSYIPGQ
jgi:hypothetical protein